jgi:hypothetical protein
MKGGSAMARRPVTLITEQGEGPTSAEVVIHRMVIMLHEYIIKCFSYKLFKI